MPVSLGEAGPLFPSLGLHPDLHLWGPGYTSMDTNTWSQQVFFCNCRWRWPFLWGRRVPKPASKLDVNKQARFPPELLSFPRDVAFLSGPRAALGRSISLPVTASSVTSGSGRGQAANKHLRLWRELAVVPRERPLLDRQASPPPNARLLRPSPSPPCPEILLLHGEDHLHPGPQHLRRGPPGGHRHPAGSQVCHLHPLLENLRCLPVAHGAEPNSLPVYSRSRCHGRF